MTRNCLEKATRLVLIVCLAVFGLGLSPAAGQEESLKPGINKPYRNPDVEVGVKRFENEKREIYKFRNEIVEACKLKPGMTVADVGAGTGLFTRLFAQKVAPGGKVYAVDIAKSFLQHIRTTCKEAGIDNVEEVLCTDTSCTLPPASVDLVFVCDTYHHFEYPFKTMPTVHAALRPGGQLIVIDFKKIKGVTSDWMMNHVRADQATVTKEISGAGFALAEQVELMKGQYFLRFERVEQ